MKTEPLVSVVIPTYNSERTIGACLQSVKEQTYQNIEVIVVDSHSKDKTVDIVENFGAKLSSITQKLLAARLEGLKESNGEYVLILDSDQILNNSVIARSFDFLKEYDMLCLEEHSFRPQTWVQQLFEADRCLVHNSVDSHLDPVEGVLLPRFYKRGILEKAFEAIPDELFPIVVAHDHAIIYYEAYKISQRVGVLPNAVWHVEPSSLIELWKKNYRYGKTTKDLLQKGFYSELLTKKVRFRKEAFTFRNMKYGIRSYLLLILKGFAYQIGYGV